eukprot:gb/GEZN01017100.1/.p1 GENE.gb/GEZN01017100.1/~~gb/GEZN01017100.1/.p1  ORF type:complete len:102 (-),score=8.88 gb/GEZN01017100.1/:135-440(-)
MISLVCFFTSGGLLQLYADLFCIFGQISQMERTIWFALLLSDQSGVMVDDGNASASPLRLGGCFWIGAVERPLLVNYFIWCFFTAVEGTPTMAFSSLIVFI